MMLSQDLSVPITLTRTSATLVPQDLLTMFKLFLQEILLLNPPLWVKPLSLPLLK